ncbi:carboxypeptidase regulatory-like domain-containing protein [Gemmatirosa kalamazoonensis]|nr:carboxypeptidase regulatory-like domain-containing protein [Gemmatirosa kalamazoonensis]
MPRSPRRRSLAAAALLLLPAAARAQVVRGTVLDVGDRAVPGVVVTLLDASSAVAARALSDERGAYRLLAPGPGTYRVHTLRIGFRPVTSAPVTLAAGEELTRRLVLTGVALALDTVRVADRAACRVGSDTATATFALWEQARGALTATQLTAATRSLGATIITYDRVLDPDGRRMRDQSLAARFGYVVQPWKELSADSLHRLGFVVSDADGSTTYHAPGLEALLSATFLTDHCFRLARSRDPSRIGIAFEPVPARRKADIRGTIWLDRKTSELRDLEFGYVNVSEVQRDRAGGAIQFVRMKDGAWAVSRWSIAMPELEPALPYSMRGAAQPRVAAIRVAGGELALATLGRDTVWASTPLVVVGSVLDSATNAPIADARVALLGTRHEARTDTAGRFRVEGVIPGEYTVEVHTPALDSLVAAQRVTVTLAEGAPPVRVRVASPVRVLAMLCGATTLRPSDGVVFGTVAAAGDTAVPRGVRVIAEWTERAAEDSAARVRWREAPSDAQGTFRLCGLPRATPLVLRAAGGDLGADPVPVTIGVGDRVARARLVLDRRADRGAMFRGVVLDDATLRPIAGAEVAMPEIARRVSTDERGAFRMTDVPAGEHRVLVRFPGFRAIDARLPFAPNGTTDRRIFLTLEPAR